MPKWILIITVFTFFSAQAQQLNCTVTINSEQVANTNQQIYKTLQTSLTEFINKTDWTGKAVKQNERINCSMFINISANNSDQFDATLQIQSSRPIFNSGYSSPIFNYNDKDFSFKYTEFERLNFNVNSYESNLISVVSFYAYLILGLDADSFDQKLGEEYLTTAQNIANIAQQGGNKGWSQSDGNQNRYFLINDLLSPTFVEIRNTLLDYHKALDEMTIDVKKSKEKVLNSIVNLSKVNDLRPNAYLTRLFFDSKSDEIVSIFSAGPSIDIKTLTDVLNRISPINSSKWAQIKY